MGYRLEVSKIKHVKGYGKLYGYLGGKENNLKSHEWLLKKRYIDGDEYWTYGTNPQIILTPDEFKEFIYLYNEDCNNFDSEHIIHPKDWIINDKETKKLTDGQDDILLEWW